MSLFNALGLSQGNTVVNKSNVPLVDEPTSDLNNPLAGNKRRQGDVSNLSESSFEQPKRTNVQESSPIPGQQNSLITVEQMIVKTVENCLSGVYEKLDKILNKMSSLEVTVEDLRRQNEASQKQVAGLLERVGESEKRMEYLEQRLTSLESRDVDSGWSPSPYKILILSC